MTRLPWVGALLVLLSTSACTSGDKDEPALSTSRPAAIVPGGSQLSAGAGAPKACVELAASDALANLSDALTSIAVDGPDSSAVATVRRAADDLLKVAQGVPEPKKVALVAAAEALDRLGSEGFTAENASSLTERLEILGEQVQPECHFDLAKA